MSRRYVYDKMNPHQFSKALDDLGLTARQFSRISGAKEANVMQWLEGKLDIPHFAYVICSLLHLPGGLDMAKRVTDLVAHDARED